MSDEDIEETKADLRDRSDKVLAYLYTQFVYDGKTTKELARAEIVRRWLYEQGIKDDQ